MHADPTPLTVQFAHRRRERDSQPVDHVELAWRDIQRERQLLRKAKLRRLGYFVGWWMPLTQERRQASADAVCLHCGNPERPIHARTLCHACYDLWHRELLSVQHALTPAAPGTHEARLAVA